MKNYNAKNIEKHSNNYWIISDLLKEYYDKDITDDELEKRLKNVDKASLLQVCHFLDIERKWYKKQYDTIEENYKLYIKRHK